MTATRRDVLKGSAIAGITLASGSLLAACSDDSGTTGVSSTPEAVAPAAAPAMEAVVVTALDKVPVGGGKICLDAHLSFDLSMVVTQPTAGVVRAFSAMCTHESCPVAEIIGKTIHCKCHGSQFSLEDGSVIEGPATRPLPEIKVKIDGANVVTA